MNAKQIAELVRREAEPFAKAVGCIIWDVKFVKEAGDWILRVTIDTEKPGSVSINMCEAVSKELDKRLDELDPIEQSYILEVSSPGVNRALSRPEDFDRFTGSSVDIKLYKAGADGEKAFTATLSGRDGDDIILLRGEKEIRLALSEIASCKIHFDF